MGTKTLGSTAAGDGTKGIFFDSSTGVAFKAHTNYYTATEDMYVDAVYVWCRPYDATSTLRHGIYKDNGAFQGQAPTAHSWASSGGNTAEWTHSEWPLASMLHLSAGLNYQAGVLTSNSSGIYTEAYNDGGQFDHWEGITSFPTTAGWTVKTWGSLPWYLTYFPTATVTGYKVGGVATTIAHVGDRLEIDGRSFSSGVTAISFNGTLADLGNMNQFADTGLNINIPAGATTGPVTVTTNAGVAVGPTLTIAGARVYRSTSLVTTKNIRVYNASILKPVVRIRAYRAGSLVDVH